MARVTEEEMRNAFYSVERVKDHPKVLFRYGFKIVEFDGEKMVEALSREEYIKLREKNEGHPIALTDPGPVCVWTGSGCSKFFGCNGCQTNNDGSGWYCSCTG